MKNEKLMEKNSNNNDQCPFCGMEYSKFERSHLIGCAVCYDFFRDRLMTVVEEIQGCSQHVGPVPDNYGLNEVETSSNLILMNRELRRSVKDEDFENAIKIRDKINEIINKRIDDYGKRV